MKNIRILQKYLSKRAEANNKEKVYYIDRTENRDLGIIKQSNNKKAPYGAFLLIILGIPLKEVKIST